MIKTIQNLLGKNRAVAARPASSPAQLSDVGAALLSPSASGGEGPRLGTPELLSAYSMMPWLRAVVGKVGGAVGAAQWMIFVVRDSGSDKAMRLKGLQRSPVERRHDILKSNRLVQGNVEQIDDHPLLDLLYYGNERLTGRAVMQLTQQHLDLAGEAFWILERDKLGTPNQVWPLPPDQITMFPTADYPYYRIKIGTQEADVPLTEIIPFIDPDPSDPYGRGTGLSRSLGDELETDEYAAKHLKGFFINRARPDIIISGETMGRDDTTRLEEAWLQKHRGFWNAWKPSFLNKKVDVHQIGMSFENMQMVDIRKYERDTIIQVFGAPPEKFGVISGSNKATIQAADLFWTKDVILPRLELIRTVLQERLVPMFDDKIILDFESPIVQDKEEKTAIMRAASGAFKINEWRAAAGLEPLEESEGGEDRIFNPGVIQVAPGERPPLPGEEVGAEGEDTEEEVDTEEDTETEEENEETEAENEDKELVELIAKQVLQKIKLQS